ncbi:MAG: hypothetical protein ACOZNI_29685 [Myxococcota bacterium]
MIWAPLAFADARFDEANAKLAAGDLAGAEAGYRALLEDGLTDGDVYYDLGNVLWRREELAGAILAWRRADARLPRDPDVEANLDFARRSVRDALEVDPPHPWFAPWQVALTPAEGAWLGAGLAGLGLLALAARRRLPHVPLVGIGGALAVAGGVVWAGGVAAEGLPPVAVVLADEVTATSDLGGGVSLFTLHAGAEVLAPEETSGQVLLQLPDGRKGWVPAQAVGLADPDRPFPVF